MIDKLDAFVSWVGVVTWGLTALIVVGFLVGFGLYTIGLTNSLLLLVVALLIARHRMR